MKIKQMDVDGVSITVERRKIKRWRLTVHPPNGDVRLRVPHRISEDAIGQVIRSKLHWIRKKQLEMRAFSAMETVDYQTGEFHKLWGNKHRLQVVDCPGKPGVFLDGNGRLRMQVRRETTHETREKLMSDYYRKSLKAVLPGMIARWEPVIGVDVAEWGVKKMRTRWGSCNILAKRIWLNLELAKQPEHCLEYVVVHEMVHLLERYHNARFRGFMTQFLPGWERTKYELDAYYLV